MRETQTIRNQVEQRLAEGMALWLEAGLPQPGEGELWSAAETAATAYHGPCRVELAAACQCFYLFRKLHTMAERFPQTATLLGDYFFSQFSQNIIPLDSVPLIDAFTAWLEADVERPLDKAAYLRFVAGLPEVLRT